MTHVELRRAMIAFQLATTTHYVVASAQCLCVSDVEHTVGGSLGRIWFRDWAGMMTNTGSASGVGSCGAVASITDSNEVLFLRAATVCPSR